MFKIKIRGITSVSDALFAAEAGADAIGLCFAERDPRCIDARLATEIWQAVRDQYSPGRVEIYAEFVDAEVDDILWILRDAELYGPEQGVGIELGGAELPSLLVELLQHGLGPPQGLLHALGHAPIVPILRKFANDASAETVRSYLEECQRLEALPDGVVVSAVQRVAAGGLPAILSGELTMGNVAAAILAATPAAVDASSGVEASPGKLDAARTWAFVAAARPALERVATGPRPPV